MDSLIEMQCEACREDQPRLTGAEITLLRRQVPEWQIVEVGDVPRLQRAYSFRDFAQALAFTNRVGDLAETADHHPAVLTEWGRTTVSWWTHKIAGLHRNDFIMAAKTDELYRTAD